jgi:hypothetical protein
MDNTDGSQLVLTLKYKVEPGVISQLEAKYRWTDFTLLLFGENKGKDKGNGNEPSPCSCVWD